MERLSAIVGVLQVEVAKLQGLREGMELELARMAHKVDDLCFTYVTKDECLRQHVQADKKLDSLALVGERFGVVESKVAYHAGLIGGLAGSAGALIVTLI